MAWIKFPPRCNSVREIPSTMFYNAHYNDVTMGAIVSQITSLTIVYSTVYSDADQSKHQSSASLAFVRGIHRSPVNSPHKWTVTRKMFPFDDVIMRHLIFVCCYSLHKQFDGQSNYCWFETPWHSCIVTVMPLLDSGRRRVNQVE